MLMKVTVEDLPVCALPLSLINLSYISGYIVCSQLPEKTSLAQLRCQGRSHSSPLTHAANNLRLAGFHLSVHRRHQAVHKDLKWGITQAELKFSTIMLKPRTAT